MKRIRTLAFGILLTIFLTSGSALLTGCCCGGGGGSGKYYDGEVARGVRVYIDENSKSARRQTIHKVAVLPFKGPTELIGIAVSDMFVTEVLQSGRYELVERSQMAKVLGETELALSGLTSSQAASAAQMIGADGVIIGSVSEYEQVAYKGRKYPSVGISARLIDSDTGKIIWSVDFADRADDKGMSLSEQARNVVHSMVNALYQEWRR
jgi:TolB-like protein